MSVSIRAIVSPIVIARAARTHFIAETLWRPAARARHNNLENDCTDKTDMNGFMTQW